MKRNITLKIEAPRQLALLCHLTPPVMWEGWLGRPVPWYAEAGGIELSDAIPENSLRLTRTAFTWSVHFPRPAIRFQKSSLTFSQITLSSAELCQLTGAKIQKWKCYGFLSHHVLLQLFLVLYFWTLFFLWDKAIPRCFENQKCSQCFLLMHITS